MRSGSLRHDLVFERLTNSSTDLDTRGQQTETWGRLALARGSIEPLRGNEAIQAHQQFPTATHLVKSRFIQSLTPSCRLRARGRTFAINQVLNLMEKDREMEVIVTEEVHG